MVFLKNPLPGLLLLLVTAQPQDGLLISDSKKAGFDLFAIGARLSAHHGLGAQRSSRGYSQEGEENALLHSVWVAKPLLSVNFAFERLDPVLGVRARGAS